MKRFLLSATVFLSVVTNAQVGINTENPDASSILDIESSNKGVLFPRIESTENITNPAEGLIIYNTTKKTLQINTGTTSTPEWRSFSMDEAEVVKKSLAVDLKCETVSINGTFKTGKELTTDNFISVKVDVQQLATDTSENSYTIETDEVNGYKFSASGTFETTGEQTIKLQGSGTPANAQTDNFTLTFKETPCNKNIEVTESQSITKIIGREGFSNSPSRRMSGSPAYFSSSQNWGYGAFGKSWSAMLYDKDLIGTSGILDAISFLIQGDRKCTAKTSNQKIYMRLVDESVFSDENNEDLNQMIKVFDGEITWVKDTKVEEGWTRIKLKTPFEYNNSKNLLIYFVNEFGDVESSCLGNHGGPDFAVDANGKDSNLILSKYKKYGTDPAGTATKSTHRLPVIKLEFN